MFLKSYNKLLLKCIIFLSTDHSNHHIQQKILSDIIPTPWILQAELNDIGILSVKENAFENKVI